MIRLVICPQKRLSIYIYTLSPIIMELSGKWPEMLQERIILDTPIFHWTMIMGRKGKFIQVPLGFQWRCRNEKNIGVRIPLIIIHIQTMEEKLAKSISRNMRLAFVGFDLSELGKHDKCRDSINVFCLIFGAHHFHCVVVIHLVGLIWNLQSVSLFHMF